MKILIIPSWFPNNYNKQNGIFFKEQAEEISKLGHEVTILDVQVVSLKNEKIFFPKLEFFVKNGIKYNRLITSKWLPKSRRYQRCMYYYGLTKIFNKIDIKSFDIIHCHSFFNAGYSTIKYLNKKNINIPVILTEHSSLFIRNLLNSTEKKYLKNSLPYFNQVISVSEHLKEFIERYTDKDIKVIPNIVNTDFFRDLNLRKNNENVVLSVGFLNKNKGMDILIESFNSINEKVPNAQLRIIGDGPEYKNLNRRIKELNLDDKIKLLGKQDRKKVVKEMNKANLFVTTSRNETFGVVIIEANSTGLPVLATKSGGPDFIIKEYNGLLANNQDISDISNKMQFLLKNSRCYNSQLIRNKTIEEYSADNVLSKLFMVYKEVLNNDE